MIRTLVCNNTEFFDYLEIKYFLTNILHACKCVCSFAAVNFGHSASFRCNQPAEEAKAEQKKYEFISVKEKVCDIFSVI